MPLARYRRKGRAKKSRTPRRTSTKNLPDGMPYSGTAQRGKENLQVTLWADLGLKRNGEGGLLSPISRHFVCVCVCGRRASSLKCPRNNQQGEPVGKSPKDPGILDGHSTLRLFAHRSHHSLKHDRAPPSILRTPSSTGVLDTYLRTRRASCAVLYPAGGKY